MIPDDLYLQSYNLGVLGISDVAWKTEQALQVVNCLSDQNYLILGGDVFKIDATCGDILITGDSWFYNKNSAINAEKNIMISKAKALDYIKKYSERNGIDFVYSIIYV